MSQNRSNLIENEVPRHELEISLVEILCFLKGAYKTILILGVTGLAIAAAYLAVTPRQYEAVAQIAMAQISGANNSVNPLGINIEEPALLISRLASPTSFPSQVLGMCGIDKGVKSAAILSKSIKLGVPKGVANVVELKTFGKSPEAASVCAQAIFELIKTTQAEIVSPYIADAKIKLDDDIERLAKAKEMVAKADKSGSAMGAAYLSTRDEIRFLLDEITALNNVVSSNQNRATRLIAPVYAGDVPSAPRNHIVLATGFIGGLFLGLVIVLGWRMALKIKKEVGGAW